MADTLVVSAELEVNPVDNLEMLAKKPELGRKNRSTATPSEQETAIVAAANAEFGAVGIRRASMDNVAARAEVSRSTLYRRFPNKDSLLVVVIQQLHTTVMDQLAMVTRGLAPKEAVVEAFVAGAAILNSSPVLQQLLADFDDNGETATVPGVRSVQVVDNTAEAIARTLRKAGTQMPEKQLRMVTEIQVRLTVSYLQIRSNTTDLSDETAVREFAENFMAPMVW